jgi:hypothetical protein
MCFAFIPILNDKKYYYKNVFWVCSWLFLYLIILDIYTKGILVLIMNYLKQLILMLFKLCIFTRRKNITNGRQLLGRFFFCPRSTVIGRPIGTGTLLAEKLDIVYQCGCVFLVKDMLILVILNVSFLAVIILMRSWTINMLVVKCPFDKTIFYIFLGFEFYLLRGDLYSSIKIMSSTLLQV